MKSLRGVADGDPRLGPWEARLTELAGEPDSIDEMLAELELPDDDADADGQLDLFGDDAPPAPVAAQPPSLPPSTLSPHHRVVTVEGREIDGTWDEIVSRLRDSSGAELQGDSVGDFMAAVASRHFHASGARLSAYDAESFNRASAVAGLLRIVR
jgi:hypothetical protein